MSAMKELLLEYLEQRDTAEEKLDAAALEVMVLANMAWANGPGEPMWAPDRWWLEGMRDQAQELLAALDELETAVDRFRS